MNADQLSPVFAGREAELSMLARAFEAAIAGTPSTVVIGAEAGGGKSRLVSEFAAAVGDRALVLTGGCVEVSAGGLPYAPFTALLRELARMRGVAEIAALIPGDGVGELAGLLPQFGTPPPGGDPEMARARLFERTLILLETLAEQLPLVLLLEDVHWADHSTCDLLTFLARSLRHAPVVLVVTFRSDELQRPLLRSLLAGLGRVGGVTRLELARLSRDQVAVQLEGILGRPPGATLTDTVYARTGGIPLFTEALVHPDGTLDPGLPWSLRDLLLAVVTELPERTRQVLRVAAVGGERVGHGALAAVTGLDDAALTAELRPALSSNVLVSDRDGYSFRHQLFREAVLEDLLPGERIHAHRGFAEALEAALSLGREGATAVELALHLRGAHENERALTAAWRAAADAGAAFAYAVRLKMLEQVLELWSMVPDAARITGTDHTGVLEAAADTARWAGEPERGFALVEAVLAEVEEAGDPERRASALRRRAGLRRELLLPGQLADLWAALQLATAPTSTRAQVIAQLCWALRREDRHDEAERLAGELRALAGRIGDDERRVEAEMLLAAEGAHRGADTGAALKRARDEAARIGAVQLEVWADLTASYVLDGRGSHELAIQAASDGLARARQLGLTRQIAAPIAANLADSLASVGRWDEALEILDEIHGLDQPPLGRVHALLVRGQIAVARGDLETASRTVSELRSLPAGVHAEAQRALPLARLEIDCRRAGGDLGGALAGALAIPAFHPQADPRYPWALLTTAMQTCAEATTVRLPPAAGDPARLRSDLELRAAGVAQRTPLHHAYVALFAAEAARAGGRHDLAAWEAAGTAWEDLGQPYPAAYAWLQAAGAAAAVGSRDGAAGWLRRAAALAGRLGARPLLQRIGRLARRMNVDLPAVSDAAAAAPFGLTRREGEVLRLLTAGHANRDIAAELFISPKTASVHVSNILAKLGVTTRVEAAALAHRQRLLDEG